jgi:hypothetical protein
MLANKTSLGQNSMHIVSARLNIQNNDNQHIFWAFVSEFGVTFWAEEHFVFECIVIFWSKVRTVFLQNQLINSFKLSSD